MARGPWKKQLKNSKGKSSGLALQWVMCLMQACNHQGERKNFKKHWDDAHVSKGHSMGGIPCANFVLKGNFNLFSVIFQNILIIYSVGSRLTLDRVARPILARPSIAQTTRHRATKTITDQMIIKEDTVNNLCWTLQSLSKVKVCAFHFFGKFLRQYIGKAEREKSIFGDFSLSALVQITISLFQFWSI